MVHVYLQCSGILCRHKKNEVMSFAATRLDLEIVTLREVSRQYHGSQSSSRGAKSPVQDKPKRKHAKTHNTLTKSKHKEY